MKIGIMGGTFDPIHNGHLMLGRCARDQFALDEIWIMPNGKPPHKDITSIEAETAHRVEMIKLAISQEERFVLQTYEVDNKEVNYSYKTMEHFKQIYPEYEFYFIIGADSLFCLEQWGHPERLLKTCIMLAAYRDGKNTTEMEEQIAYLTQKFDADIRLLNMPNVDIASRNIRRQLQMGLSVDGKIPKSVSNYITDKKLYSLDLIEMCEKVKSQQTEKRYEHTLGVMYTAAALAMRYSENIKKAMVAGLFHDCAKGIPADLQLQYCEEYGIEITDAERFTPELLHAKLGAYFAKTKYEVDDEDILESIAYHTTGKPNMTTLNKIIYIADFIEPNRNHTSHLTEIRRLAFEDLDQCLVKTLESTLSYLKTKKWVIDPMTEKTYEYYKKAEV